MSTQLNRPKNKKRQRWEILLILLPLLGLLGLAVLFLVQNIGPSQQPEFIALNLHSALTADYRIKPDTTRVPGVRLDIIWDAILDRAPQVTDIEARKAALLANLQTPVPFVTPAVCQGIHTIHPSQDTWIDSARPAATHGQESFLQVGRAGTGLQRVLLNFDIDPQIPPGTYIRQAYLELNLDRQSGTASPESIQLFSLAAPFLELETNWANQPKLSAAYRTSALTSPNDSHAWDVTDLVQDRLLGNYQTIGLGLDPQGVTDFAFIYFSREATSQTSPTAATTRRLRPRLIIDCGDSFPQPKAVAAIIPSPTPTSVNPKPDRSTPTPISPPAADTPIPPTVPPAPTASPPLSEPTLPPPPPTAASPEPTVPASTPTASPPQPPPTPPDDGSGDDSSDDDTPSPPSLTINNATITEGDAGTIAAIFTVSLSAATDQTVTAEFTTADDTATAPTDYAATSGTLTFAPGTTQQTLNVIIQGDTLDEINETFLVNLSNAANATISDGQGLGTITDDDAPPTLTINDVSVAEGNAGTVNATFTVSLSTASGQTVRLDYVTANNTAAAPTDYLPASGSLTFNPGATSQTIAVTINGDTTPEANETFLVNLSNAANATIADSQGVGTILNDDGLTVSINNVTVTEGNAGPVDAVFSVSLSTVSSNTVSVDYATTDNTATADSDYLAIPITQLTFPPGITAQTITVTVQGDILTEINESFFVNLSNPLDVTVANGQGVGTIIDDDGSSALCSSPAITLTATADTYLRSNQPNDNFGSDGDLRTKPPSSPRNSLIQFDLGSIPANSVVTCAALLLHQTSSADSGQNIDLYRVTNNWDEGQATWNDRAAGNPWANPGGDFHPDVVATFVPDTANHAINVSSLAQFWVNNPGSNYGLLLGARDTGSNNEIQYASRENGVNPPPRLVVEYLPGLSISDVSVTEGNSGTTTATFNVTLSATSAQTVTVAYATSDNTATIANNDYIAATGILTFTPGITIQPITVQVVGDTNPENTESFFVNLNTPTNAAILDGQGVGTIVQDIDGLALPGDNEQQIYLPLIKKLRPVQ